MEKENAIEKYDEKVRHYEENQIVIHEIRKQLAHKEEAIINAMSLAMEARPDIEKV